VSNTYNGFITLTVGTLNAGETVVVQKFADGNTNGAVDATDFLVEQFTLTDGAAEKVGSVTNINVPGDTDTTAGQITAKLNFQNGDFSQNFIGKYLFKLSRTSGETITNVFTVTNATFAASGTISGSVTNGGTNVPYATVVLFQPSGDGLNPVSGCVANSTGAYSIKTPPGNYLLMSFKTNFVANSTTAPTITLTNGANVTANLALLNATVSIAGKIVDAANTNLGLPGVFISAQSTNRLIAISFTDTNGNYSLRVTASDWKLDPQRGAVALHGYLTPQSNPKTSTAGGSVTGFNLALPKVAALFYGSVKTDTGTPLVGVRLYDSDQTTYLYEDDPLTDANGNYVGGALAGTWQLQIDNNNPGFTNYVFTQDIGQTNLNTNTVVLQNFIAKFATNHIAGYVHDSSNHPIANLNVYAYATINATNYQALGVNTDTNGNFWLNVANGPWNVGVNCNGGDNSLDGILGNGTYLCPDNQPVGITNNNGTANFTIQPCNGVQITTTNLPDGEVGTTYDEYLAATSCGGNFNWQLAGGNFPAELDLYSNGEIYGTPTNSGNYTFIVQVTDGNNVTTNRQLQLHIAAVVTPLQVDTVSLPNGTNGLSYSASLAASGGQSPYSWAIPPYSAGLPGNLILNTNGTISGIPTNGGFAYFYARVTDAALNTADSAQLQLYFVNQPLVITNTTLPKGTVGAPYTAQLGATGGQLPYNCWSLAAGSANPPPGLTLNCDGSITGTPTNAGTFFFLVQAMDGSLTTATKPLSITINDKPVLSSPFWRTNRFQTRLTGVTGQNYTIQYSTTLSNWNQLLITNSGANNSLLVTDPAATNKLRAYRVLVGP
jgi:hypothetical protein